jgi:hypothetical protein
MIIFGLAGVIELTQQKDWYNVENLTIFLKNNNIDRIYTEYHLKWQLLFDSNESIVASCIGLCPCRGKSYPLYDEVVDKEINLSRSGLVFNKNSTYERKLKDFLSKEKISFEVKEIQTNQYTRVVFYNLSEKIKPKDFIDRCKYSDYYE